jgi:hypothetical protein
MTNKRISQKLKTIWIIIVCFNIIPSYAEISDAILVNQQTDLLIRNCRLYISRSYELKVNNRQGEEYAEISIPYSKLSKVSKIEAYIKDKDGIVVKKLKSGDIKERSSISEGSFYEDDFVKEFTLIHNIYPYTIFYSYQVQEESFLYLDSWSPCFYKNIPTLNAVLTLDVPNDYKIKYTSQLVDSMRVDTAESRIKYTWVASYTHQLGTEIYAPDQSVFLPRVDIVPEKFKFDQEGSQNSWGSYGNWMSRLLIGLNDLPNDEKQHVNLLIDNAKSDKEKIKILYHYLQDATRYINISILTGGMKPYPASYVAINKYGDCKALSNYFQSILSYIGIPSFYTHVKSGKLIKKVNQSFPSMQFDHIILCVPLSKDTIWLDCTSDGPYNYLGIFTQNRYAFIIDKVNSHFTRTPVLSKEEVLDSRAIHIHSVDGNDLEANFHTISRGESFEALSGLTRLTTESKKSQIIHKYLIESGFEMVNFNLIPAHRDSTFITLDYIAKTNNLFKKYGNELLIPLIPFSIPAFKDPKNRKYPVQLDYPIYNVDTIDYLIPVGYQLSSLPKDQSVNSIYGKYTLKFLSINNGIEVVKSFILNSGDYPLTEYKDFYKYVRTVYDIENKSYIVTKKQN